MRENRYRRGEKSTSVRVGILGNGPALLANWGGRIYGVPLSLSGTGNEARDANFGSLSLTAGSAVFSTGATTLKIASDGLTVSESGVEVAKFGATTTVKDINLTGKINITSTGSANVMIGKWASTNPDLSTIDNNVFIGVEAGALVEANASSTESTHNIFIGHTAGGGQETPYQNIAIGSDSGKWIQSNYNVCLGWGAGTGLEGTPTTGANNTYVGRVAGNQVNGASEQNTVIGSVAMANYHGATTDPFKKNVMVGYTSGLQLHGGENNTWIGTSVSSATTAAKENSVCLGYASPTQGDNTVMLGNSSTDTTNGLYCYDTGIASPSDASIKDNITNISYGLNFVNKLRPVSYKKKHPADYPSDFLEERFSSGEDKKKDNWTAKTEVGLIAQEVKEVINSLGIEFHGHNTMLSGMESLKYVAFITPLIKSVQELSAKIDNMEERLTNLEGL